MAKDDAPTIEDLTSVSPGYAETQGWPPDFACMSPGYVQGHYRELLQELDERGRNDA